MLVEKLAIMYLFIYLCVIKRQIKYSVLFFFLSKEAFFMRQETTQFNYDHIRDLHGAKT